MSDLPMFTLNGQIVNVYVSPKGVNKETGTEYGGQDKVQILGNIPVANGQYRKDLVTLTTEQGQQLKHAIGASVSAPIGIYVNKGSAQYYIPKGSLIDLGEAS